MEVEHTLKSFQELVDGYIEVVPVSNDGSVLMVVNEEGKLLNLEKNILFRNDVIVGNIVFVQNSFEDEEFVSLSDEWCNLIMKLIK